MASTRAQRKHAAPLKYQNRLSRRGSWPGFERQIRIKREERVFARAKYYRSGKQELANSILSIGSHMREGTTVWNQMTCLGSTNNLEWGTKSMYMRGRDKAREAGWYRVLQGSRAKVRRLYFFFNIMWHLVTTHFLHNCFFPISIQLHLEAQINLPTHSFIHSSTCTMIYLYRSYVRKGDLRSRL